jgi:hypothetical protein
MPPPTVAPPPRPAPKPTTDDDDERDPEEKARQKRYLIGLGIAAVLFAFIYYLFLSPDTSHAVSVYATEGIVLDKGQPVAKATVEMYPEGEGSIHRPRTSITAADGTFKVSTFGEADGAPAGKYKVTVTCPRIEEIKIELPEIIKKNPSFKGDQFKGQRVIEREVPDSDRWQKKYSNINTTTLTAEIKSGSNRIELKLE